MHLQPIDWACIAVYFVVALIIGVALARRAGSSVSEYFLAGRHMPWWLLGVSMVATTFSTDTPNLVTDITRTHGVSGNWLWWAFLLTGMLTVFVYAKLWRRSGVLTDIEFYEVRYSGAWAAFLRGFRAIYLGVLFNVMIMAAVTVAAIKIGGVLLGMSPFQTIFVASVVTVIYCMLGGLSGVLFTDFILFFIAMLGSVLAAIVAVRLPEVGGLSKLLSHPNVTGSISILPDFSKMDAVVIVLIVPLAVQWWSVWYPGSEPGGGGYVAQRMLAAKNEKHAMGATLLFNVAHYALRPWPWIIVALCSMIVFPDLQAIREAFPNVDPAFVKNDTAYPAMLTFLPTGLRGLVVASLIAAYMSTISTHLNWGSSYVVNDFYKRFIRTQADEKELVMVGRVSTVALMFLAAGLSLYLSNALQAFNILLQIGAGTGLLFILRWFWWRVNAVSEVSAMVVSFMVALYFQFVHAHVSSVELADWQKLLIGVGVTTVGWVGATFLTRPVDNKTLCAFYRLVRPGGPGWKKILALPEMQVELAAEKKEGWDVPVGILCMVLGCFAVYSALFAAGYWIYSNTVPAVVLSLVAVVSTSLLVKSWAKLKTG